MSEPRLHPNGFIQYDLPGRQGRLHIWHPDLPVAQIVHTPIHDHTFDFKSRVIFGRLMHTIYRFDDRVDGDYRLHRAVVSAGEDTRLEPTPLVGNMNVTRIHYFSLGERYTFSAGRFHTSEGNGLVATIMQKTRTGVSEYPMVAVPVSVDPDNNFRRHQADAEVLMGYVELVGRLSPLEIGV